MRKYFYSFTLLIALSGFSQDQVNIHNVPYIEVSGEGMIEITPNEIYLAILIDEADRGRLSMEKLENDMIQKLKELGIRTDEQLKVLDFNSAFRSRVIGQKINTSKRYELLLRKSSNVPRVYREFEELGISNINIVRIDHSNREEFELKARLQAVADAKKRATAMLAELDDKIGSTLYVQDRNSFQDRGAVRSEAALFYKSKAGYAADEALNDIDFRTIVLKANVQVRFGIAD